MVVSLWKLFRLSFDLIQVVTTFRHVQQEIYVHVASALLGKRLLSPSHYLLEPFSIRDAAIYTVASHRSDFDLFYPTRVETSRHLDPHRGNANP